MDCKCGAGLMFYDREGVFYGCCTCGLIYTPEFLNMVCSGWSDKIDCDEL